MTAQEMWAKDLEDRIAKKIYNEDILEVPLAMYVCDLPEFHKFTNKNSSAFLDALANTDNIAIFENVSVRSFIEFKWPPIKAGIKRALFFPYLTFLLFFLVYSVWIFEYNQVHTSTFKISDW